MSLDSCPKKDDYIETLWYTNLNSWFPLWLSQEREQNTPSADEIIQYIQKSRCYGCNLDEPKNNFRIALTLDKNSSNEFQQSFKISQRFLHEPERAPDRARIINLGFLQIKIHPPFAYNFRVNGDPDRAYSCMPYLKIISAVECKVLVDYLSNLEEKVTHTHLLDFNTSPQNSARYFGLF